MIFANQSKTKIVEEINGIAKARDPQTIQIINQLVPRTEGSVDGVINMMGDIADRVGDIAGTILENFPIPFGNVIGKISRDTGSLVNQILKKIPGFLDQTSTSLVITETRNTDPFVFKFKTEKEARQLLETMALWGSGW